MVFVRLSIAGKSGEEVRDSADFGPTRGAVFGRRILRRYVTERGSGLEELKELGWEFVGHSDKRKWSQRR